ncbi:hypothetical protein V8C37DRAFT_371738 [Trichoderma ceciliae]
MAAAKFSSYRPTLKLWAPRGFTLFLFRRSVATAGALHGGPLTRCDTLEGKLLLAPRRFARQ